MSEYVRACVRACTLLHCYPADTALHCVTSACKILPQWSSLVCSLEQILSVCSICCSLSPLLSGVSPPPNQPANTVCVRSCWSRHQSSHKSSCLSCLSHQEGVVQAQVQFSDLVCALWQLHCLVMSLGFKIYGLNSKLSPVQNVSYYNKTDR